MWMVFGIPGNTSSNCRPGPRSLRERLGQNCPSICSSKKSPSATRSCAPSGRFTVPQDTGLRILGLGRSLLGFLGKFLLKKFPENVDEEARAAHLRFVMKFQKCTGPVMTRGVEDRSFYIYNRLVALNEVGGEPHHFSLSPE